MPSQPRVGLYLFNKDLRLDDLPGLIKLNLDVDQLILVYFDEPWILEPNAFGLFSQGQHRRRFVYEGLYDLNQQLLQLGQQLIVKKANIATGLPALCQQHGVSHIGHSLDVAPYEVRHIDAVRQALPQVSWETGTSNHLFEEAQLPSDPRTMKNTFTPWRKQIEASIEPVKPVDKPTSLNPPVPGIHSDIELETPSHVGHWRGGENAGLAQLQYYLWETRYISQYKETRNGMVGWDYSSKFSAWLASGMLSPRRVADELFAYEQDIEQNDSTYWLYFELLWREFFHWQLVKHQHVLFAAEGFKGNQAFGEFDAQRFTRWCEGKTGCEIVDAGMRELQQTGFMSNRARQLCASYFIHELNLHWRYGAAWFEQQLIDYDVASNWGNWLYLAGGGSDPRGQRKFNMQKQTDMYDSDGQFRRAWL